MAVNPTFSVVIPTCGRPESLRACVTALSAGSYAPNEIIVTDDGAETAERMLREEFPLVRSVAGPRKGPAANRNHGASHAMSEWLAFTDDDCLPEPNWLEAFARAAEANPATLVLEGRTTPPGPRRLVLETAPINETGGVLWSCNFAIRRTFFESLGGFDERFPHAAMEDMDLAARIKKAHQSWPFVRGACVVHPWRIMDVTRVFLVMRHSEFIYAELHPDESHLLSLRYWLRVYLRGLRESFGNFRRYPREMLATFPRYVCLEALHIWALATNQKPVFFAQWLERLDRFRASSRHSGTVR